ncbi:MAG: hypothetical protein SZ59_C0003G0044 [candidate division TM6 bacterium GW2011_GWF2_28_16]|nr:MAG: hypothetical protein SZ59_C0003G0044 [candidate division TM6 bacterium GW2011_GWF2_28_16]
MLKFLKLKNTVTKGLLLFLFIFSINNLDAGERKKIKREFCGLPIPFTEMPLINEILKRTQDLADDNSSFHNYNDDISAAVEGMKSDGFMVQEFAIELFEALFKKDKGFDEVIKIAGELIMTDLCYQSFAVKLFKCLFKKGKGFGEAIKVAEEAIKFDNWRIQRNAINLFRALVKKRHEPAYIPAIKAMASCLRSNVSGLNVELENLLEDLSSLSSL